MCSSPQNESRYKAVIGQLQRMCFHMLTGGSLGCFSDRVGTRCRENSSISQPSGDRGRLGTLGMGGGRGKELGGGEDKAWKGRGAGNTPHSSLRIRTENTHRTSNFKAPTWEGPSLLAEAHSSFLVPLASVFASRQYDPNCLSSCGDSSTQKEAYSELGQECSDSWKNCPVRSPSLGRGRTVVKLGT